MIAAQCTAAFSVNKTVQVASLQPTGAAQGKVRTECAQGEIGRRREDSHDSYAIDRIVVQAKALHVLDEPVQHAIVPFMRWHNQAATACNRDARRGTDANVAGSCVRGECCAVPRLHSHAATAAFALYALRCLGPRTQRIPALPVECSSRQPTVYRLGFPGAA